MEFEQINSKIDWEKVGHLLPAIIQNSQTGEVLMLGYLNQAALKITMETQKVTFFSRTKQRLWTKGETSGNFLQVINYQLDCDQDTLLILVEPIGPTCHLGTSSCFYPLSKAIKTHH